MTRYQHLDRASQEALLFRASTWCSPAMFGVANAKYAARFMHTGLYLSFISGKPQKTRRAVLQ
jgi:hypothetical protein